jgi:hypothetical protein
VEDDDEATPQEAKPRWRFRGWPGLATAVSLTAAVTIGGVEAVPHITAHFEANGSGTTHSGNQNGTGNNIQDSGSGSNTQNGSKSLIQGGKNNTQVKGKGSVQKAGANSIQNAGPGSINIGSGSTGGTGGTGGVGGAGGTGGTGGHGGNGVVLTAPAGAPRAVSCTAKPVVSAPSQTGATVSGRVSIPCLAPSGQVYYLIVELDNQGTDNTTNYYPKQEFTGAGTQPFTFNAQSVGSRKVFVVRVDDGEATQLEQLPDGDYLFSLPGSLVSNVVTTTRTS